jgi:hypothetical protein
MMNSCTLILYLRLSVYNAAQENVMNAHRGIHLFLVVVNQPKNITTIITMQIII